MLWQAKKRPLKDVHVLLPDPMNIFPYMVSRIADVIKDLETGQSCWIIRAGPL